MSGHLKILEVFFVNIFTHKSETKFGRILGKIKMFGQHFVPIKTAFFILWAWNCNFNILGIQSINPAKF